MTKNKELPAKRWGLTERDRVTIDGVEWVIYSDELYTWAVLARDYDEPTAVDDYSLWCAGTGASDPELCRRILAATDEMLVQRIWTAGACEEIERNQ